MIIDMHVHMGRILNFHMPEKMVLESMEKYHIDFALVSNVEATEADHDQVPLPQKVQISQLECCKRQLAFAKEHPDKIGALLWVKPLTECCDEAFETLIKENRKYIYGLKVHPYHSVTPFSSEKVIEYVELAQKYSLPVLVHTASDPCSSPDEVYKVALQFPKVNFVMGHMGLGTDNQRAMELIAKVDNLYGDTTWVNPKKVLKAIQVCGEDKIMFGTDNPIDGVDTYDHKEFYRILLGEFNSTLTQNQYEKLMWRNAAQVFGIATRE